MATADVLHRVEPALGEDDVASWPLHGLDDQGSHLVHAALGDRRLERVGGNDAIFGFAQPTGTPIAIGRGPLAEGPPALRFRACQSRRAGRPPRPLVARAEAVVGAVERDDFRLAGHPHRQLDRGPRCHRPRPAEDRLVEPTGADLRQSGGELDHRWRVVDVEVIGDQLQLRGDRRAYLGMAVADERRPVGPRDSVEILTAVDVPDPRSAGAIENETTIAAPPLNGVEHVPIRGVAQPFGTKRVGLGAVHEGLNDRVRAAGRPRRIAAGPGEPLPPGYSIGSSLYATLRSMF